MNRDWWTPLTGVAFIVLVIIAFSIGGEPPDADEPVREIVSHYVDDKDSIFVGAIIGGFAGAMLIFFAGVLRRALRAAEGESGVLSLVAYTGLVIIAIGIAIDGTITIALAEAAEDIDPVGVQALQALWDNDFLPFAMGNLVFLTATGLSIIRHGALPKWLGWAALVLAVAALTPAGFIAFLGAAVWLLIASVMLTLRARAAPPAAV